MRRKWFPTLRLLLGLFLLVDLVVLSFVGWRLTTVEPLGAEVFSHLERPLVIAHRGGRDLWPENTLFAFERAWAAGVDVLELDVHLSADGYLVVHHDATLDRTTDGSGPLAERTLAELRALDASAHFEPAADVAPELVPDLTAASRESTRIPTLDEVFDRFPEASFVIEVKPDSAACARATAQAILGRGLGERVILGSSRPVAHRTLVDEFPELLVSASKNEIREAVVLSRLGLGRLHQPRGAVFQVPLVYDGVNVLDPAFLEVAHRAGQEVQVWTVDEVDEMRRVLDWGVDGVMTDRPDRLLELVPRPRREQGLLARAVGE